MDSTHEFVEKLHDTQEKDEQNRTRGKGHPEKQLPTKKHNNPKHSK